MSCYTIYDCRNDHISWIPFAASAVLLVAGCAVAYWGRRSRSRLRWVPLTFAVCWSVLMVGITVREQVRITEAVKSGNVDRVEGFITTYEAVPAGVKGRDSFVVGDQTFRVTEDDFSPGFHQTRHTGSPLAPGMYVKITSTADDVIVRIDRCFRNPS